MTKLQNPVQMAVIGAAHGIKGELRVKTFTGEPLALADYGPLYAKDGRAFEIIDIRPQGTVVVVRFKGVSDRNAAEALTGTELFVERAALSADVDDEDEFYHADLVGLSVVDENGAAIGKVVAVQNFGGGDILEVTGPGRKGVLMPFTKAAVPVVDSRRGRYGRHRRQRVCCRTTRTANRRPSQPRRRLRPEATPTRTDGRRRQPVSFPRQRADALSGDVSGAARPVAGRPRAGGRHLVAGSRSRSAISPAIATARSTTRRPAAAPAW